LARPVVNGLRHEYQDRINFVVLDFDRADDLALAKRLGVGDHPAFAVVEPGTGSVVERRFGPQPESAFRAWLDGIIAKDGA
jgi:thioredoxin-like negative regulator of GroEL